MELIVWPLIVANVTLTLLVVYLFRDRQYLTRSIDSLKEENYRIRKKSGMLTDSERVAEGLKRISSALRGYDRIGRGD